MRFSVGALILKSVPGSGRVCCRCYDAFTGLWREIRSGRRMQVDVAFCPPPGTGPFWCSPHGAPAQPLRYSLFCLGNNAIIRRIIPVFRLEISVAFLRDYHKDGRCDYWYLQ